MTETPFDQPNDNIINQKEYEETGKFVEKIGKKSEKKAQREQGWHIGKAGMLPRINNIFNIVKIEKDENLVDLFRLNEFTGEVEYMRDSIWGGKAGRELEDKDIIFILGYLAKKYFFEPPKSVIGDAVVLLASENRIHPVKKYLESLSWDGKNRLDMWLQRITGADNNEYVHSCGRKILCAAVHRIYNPGEKFDHMLILEGKQRLLKSTTVEVLGHPWYAPINMIENAKDAVDVMHGKWFLEMEELAAMRKPDVEHIKSFISRKTDRVRLSYGRRAADFPRQSVIIGTLNPIGDNQYFKDVSGNTRFWPIVCKKKIDLDWLRENKDQLFAEALKKYKGERLFLDTNVSIEIAEQEQQARQLEDTWEDIIEEWIGIKNAVTPLEVLTMAIGFQKDKIQHSNIVRVGICMRKLGWLPRKFGARQKKYYVRPDADINKINDEINNKPELWKEEEE